MNNTTFIPTNNRYKNFDFSKYITLTDLQNITTKIIYIICLNAFKEDRSVILIEASEVVTHLFRNDILSDYVVGTISKNSRLIINQNENTLLDSLPNSNN
jgi:hypothetical protein